MRKIHEHRFPTIQRAIEYVESAEWQYVGRKGVFRKYDRYIGSCFYAISGDTSGGEHETRFALKLYQDGYVCLCVIKDTSGNPPIGTTKLPELVWPSASSRNFTIRMVKKVNDVLEESRSDMWVKFHHHPSKFPLYMKHEADPIDILKSPLEAIDYDPNREGLSNRAEQLLYRAVNGQW